jgi:hypothetical protein
LYEGKYSEKTDWTTYRLDTELTACSFGTVLEFTKPLPEETCPIS